MLGFGSTTESGAKRFSQVSKQLRSTSSDLYALGFSTQDLNNGLAKYGQMQKMQGLQGTQSNAQLASGAKKYLKELDALAKITGMERSAKEAEMMAMLKDAQFQGAMATKSKEVRESFLSTVGGLAGGMQGPLGNFAKDILATGTATTEENQKLLGMMPDSAKLLQQFKAKMDRGEALTEAERNELNNTMAREGAKASKQMGSTFAAAPEFAQTMNALTLAQSMQQNALKDATAEQKKSAAATDGTNKAAEEAKARLAALSNSFQMVLVNSGLLDTLMKSFEFLANVVMKYVVPVFNFFASAITTAVNFVTAMFSTSEMGAGFGLIITKAKELISSLFTMFTDIASVIDVKGIFDNFKTIFGSLVDTIKSLSVTMSPLFQTIATVAQDLFDKLTPIFKDIMDIISTLAKIIMPIITPIVETLGKIFGGFFDMLGGLVKIIKGILHGDFSTIWEGMKQTFGGFFDMLGNIVKFVVQDLVKKIQGVWNWITGKGEKSDEDVKKLQDEDKKKKEADARAGKEGAEAQARQKRLDEQNAAVAKATEEAKKKAAEEEKKKKAAEEKKAGDAKKEAKAAAEPATAAKDYNDSLSLLKSEYAAANPTKSQPVAKAEASKQAIVAAAEQKTAEAAKIATTEAEAKKLAASGSTSKAAPATTQESAESLLASLNTKLDRLIQVNHRQLEIGTNQLSVQQGLSGNLLASV
jgi:hypothetical protein